MLSGVMEFFDLSKDLRNVGYFETEQSRQVFKDVKAVIKQGRIIVLSGMVGCGKTTTLRRIQTIIGQEREILVSRSMSVDKAHTTLNTLLLALFFDLSTDKEVKMPAQTEARERKLEEMVKKRQKPVALFVDEAHDLHGNTLIGLKRLMELFQQCDGTLSIVLAGHPKLKNDLRRPTMEEIGSRAVVFMLDGIKSNVREYMEWLLEGCLAPKVKLDEVITTEAVGLLAEKLTTPLQVEHYLNLAFEEAYKIAQRPLQPDLIKNVLAVDINGLAAKLTRQGYNLRSLSEMLNVRRAEVKSLFCGQLPTERAQQLKDEMIAVGIPV